MTETVKPEGLQPAGQIKENLAALDRPTAEAPPSVTAAAESAKTDEPKDSGAKAAAPPAFDAEAFAANMARIAGEGGRALAAYLKPDDPVKSTEKNVSEWTEVSRTLGQVLEYWLSDPTRSAQMQSDIGRAYLDLWGQAMRRLTGEDASPAIAPDPRDKRFRDPEWTNNQFFDFVKQAYLLAAKWGNELVDHADGLDPHTRHKAQFYVQQIANALSPSNFVLTNPELLRETLGSSGDNLARGMKMLADDVEAGKGTLRVRQTDTSKFMLGRDVATTPGKVIYQNKLIQLIQYSPTTENVLRTPLLIVPPWINKYYILDLNAEKSFIKWCVDQGLTVFCISWVNPGAEHASLGFDDYMELGPLAAMDAVQKVTGEARVHTIGYCVGGTMLSITAAWLAAQRRVRISSMTLFASQVDFTHAGDLLVFADEEQISSLEKDMQAHGYLDAKKMAAAFNMLRPNELIWPYVINTYLKGKAPMPFDLLFWNSDSTRMTAANHSFYLRNCYLENSLAKGEMEVGGIKLDLSKVKVPVYVLSTREDHIAPAKSGFFGMQYFSGPTRFVLAGSGHIAGVINPPALKKYQYWTNDRSHATDLETWLKTAKENPGSWWPDWIEWIRTIDPEEVPARPPGTGALDAIEDAPGSYVKVQS